MQTIGTLDRITNFGDISALTGGADSFDGGKKKRKSKSGKSSGGGGKKKKKRVRM